MRREVELGDHPRDSNDGVLVTVHRKGIDVFGWHGAYGNGEPIELTWAQIDEARSRVNGTDPL